MRGTLKQAKFPPFCSYNLERFRDFRKLMVDQKPLLLGIDGGGTQSRARLSTYSGTVLAAAEAGPANLRLGLETSFSTVLQLARPCLSGAGFAEHPISQVIAFLALAGAHQACHRAGLHWPGARDATPRAAAKQYGHPFRLPIIAPDAHADFVGGQGGRGGGVISAGPGAVGGAVRKGQDWRIGGWGPPISDEGSGA